MIPPANKFLSSSFLSIGFLLFSLSSIQAGWVADGVAVSTAAKNQVYAATASDGLGGAIITWVDHRNDYPAFSNGDIFAQRLDAQGNVLWTADGVAICTAPKEQTYPGIVSDDSGGAIIVWQDQRSGTRSQIYAQRVNGSGVVQWATDGVQISPTTADQVFPKIVTDGAGGAFIVWEDWAQSYSKVLVGHIDASGNVGWNASGVLMDRSPSYANEYESQAASDGLGGVLVTWTTIWGVEATRVTGSGGSPWGVYGKSVTSNYSYQYNPTITSDGSGGAIITWDDDVNSAFSDPGRDIWAQHIDSSGTLQWGNAGMIIYGDDLPFPSGPPSIQDLPVIASDGAGGAIIAWRDNRNSTDTTRVYELYAQRVNGSGSLLWSWNGIPLCSVPYDQQVYFPGPSEPGPAGPVIIEDGSGGAIVVWDDNRSGTDSTTSDVYAQRIDSTGTLLWTATGAAICLAPNSQGGSDLVSDGSGGAIIAWGDWRSGSSIDIYALRVWDETVGTAFKTFRSFWRDDHIEIVWEVEDITDKLTFNIFRRENTDETEVVLSNPEITRKGDQFILMDRTAEPGETYTYRVTMEHEGVVLTSFQTTVIVPVFLLQLLQNYPNPFNLSTRIESYNRKLWIVILRKAAYPSV